MKTILLLFSFPALAFVILLFIYAFKNGDKYTRNTKHNWLNAPIRKPSEIKKYDPTGSTNLWSYGNYRQYLRSDQWNNVRLTTIQRDHFKCTRCGSSRKLQVHHKTYVNVFFESDHLDDLETLCKYCHELVNHRPILKTWT